MQVALLFPRTDTSLLQWSQNFLNLIQASPTTYGLVAADATDYATVHDAYSTALAACDRAVRNKSAVVTKNAAKAALKAKATLLANKIYSTATVTDAQKTELGIPPRATPSTIPAPSGSPVVELISTMGNTVRIRLRDGSGARRGKPAGVSGASVFSYVGATPPGDISGWKFEGNAGRVNKIDITFSDSTVAGSNVWLTAFWFNGRKQSGPASTPVGVNLPGGGVLMAA